MDAASFWIFGVTVDHSTNEGLAGNSDKHSRANPKECEAGESKIPTADLSEDDRVRREAEVKDGVNDSDVDIPEDAAKCG